VKTENNSIGHTVDEAAEVLFFARIGLRQEQKLAAAQEARLKKAQEKAATRRARLDIAAELLK